MRSVHMVVLSLGVLAALVADAFTQTNTWIPTAGPYGSSVNHLVSRGDTLVASTPQLFRSTDGGMTWTVDFSGTFNCTVIDSSGYEWGTWYFGTLPNALTYRSPGDRFAGQMASSDSLLHMPVPSGAVAPDGTRYFVGGESGNRFFTCKGNPWDLWTMKKEIGGSVAQHTIWALNPRTGALHVAGRDTANVRRYFRSVDGGDHFTSAVNPADSVGATSTLDASATRDGAVYLTVTHTDGTTQFYRTVRSLDDGLTWNPVNKGLAPLSGLKSVIDGAGSTRYAKGISPSGTVIYVSRDGGESWSVAQMEGIHGVMPNFITCVGDSTIVMSGVAGGLFRSTDNGDHWDVSAAGISWATVYGIAADSSGMVFAATAESGVYRTSDRGTSWDRCVNGIAGGGNFELTITKQGTVIAGSSGLGVFRSTDHGTTWSSLSTGLPSNNISHIASLVNGNVLAWTYPNGMYVSTDDGMSWTAASSVPSSLYAYQFAVGDQNTALLLTEAGPYRTSDGGAHWQLSIGGLTDPSMYHATFTQGDTVIAAVGLRVVRSYDGGISWTEGETVPTVGSTAAVASIDYAPSVGLLMSMSDSARNVAVDGTHIYASRDNGHTWTDFNHGFEYHLGWTFSRIVSVGNSIFAATSSGVFRNDVSTGVAPPSVMPKTMLSVSPSPVTQTGTVHVQLEHAAGASIRIFDALGRERATIATATDVRDAGMRDVSFDTQRLEPGIYVCRMMTATGSASCTFEIVR